MEKIDGERGLRHGVVSMKGTLGTIPLAGNDNCPANQLILLIGVILPLNELQYSRSCLETSIVKYSRNPKRSDRILKIENNSKTR